MKKLLKYLLCMMMTLTVFGCSTSTNEKDDTAKILCPNGAPSLAFVHSYKEITKKGKIDFVDGSDQLVAQLSKKDSDYNMIVAPINLGAKLISAKQTDFKIAGVLTWGNLYLVGTNQSELKENNEVALFGQGAVPQKIFEQTNSAQLKPTYYQSTTLVQQKLLTSGVKVGLLAEPLASATIAKASQSGLKLSILKDLQKSYGKDGYPQAAIFIKEKSNFSQLLEDIDTFTNKDKYKGLKKDIETVGIDQLGLPSVDIAVNTINRQNIHYKEASQCVDDMKNFLKLFNISYTKDMIIQS